MDIYIVYYIVIMVFAISDAFLLASLVNRKLKFNNFITILAVQAALLVLTLLSILIFYEGA